MKNYRTPHTFDMSDYYSGRTVVLGGRDFEREENEGRKEKVSSKKNETKKVIKLDWSFLKNSPKTR